MGKGRNFKRNCSGFVLMTMLVLLIGSSLVLVSAYLLSYIHEKAFKKTVFQSVVQRCIEQKLLYIIDQFQTCQGQDICAVADEAFFEKKEEKVKKGWWTSSYLNEWKIFPKKSKERVEVNVWGRSKKITIELDVKPALENSMSLLTDNRQGGFKADINQVVGDYFEKYYKGKSLWKNGISWDLIKKYKDFLCTAKHKDENLENCPQGLGAEYDFCFWDELIYVLRTFKKMYGDKTWDQETEFFEKYNQCIITPIIRSAYLKFGLKAEPLHTATGIKYILSHVILVPEIVLHNPYNIPLECKNLLCIWNLDFQVGIYCNERPYPVFLLNKRANTFFEEDDTGELSLRDLIANADSADVTGNKTEGLIFHIPSMRMEPGEHVTLRIVSEDFLEYRGQPIKMARACSVEKGAVLIDLPQGNILGEEGEADLAIKNLEKASVQNLKLYQIVSNGKDPLWEARQIPTIDETQKSNEDLGKKVVGTMQQLSKSPIFIGDLQMHYNGGKVNREFRKGCNNLTGSSLNAANWTVKYSTNSENEKRSNHSILQKEILVELPTYPFQSIADLVHIPIIPLDLFPQYILGSSWAGKKHDSQRWEALELSYYFNQAYWDSYCVYPAPRYLMLGSSVTDLGKTKFFKIPIIFQKEIYDFKGIKKCNQFFAGQDESLYCGARDNWLKGGFNVNTLDSEQWYSFFKKHLILWEDAICEELAWAVVQRLKQYGPVRSVAEFINFNPSSCLKGEIYEGACGILQQAIIDINLLDREGHFLNQAHIVTRVADALTVRWDTWCVQIRAFEEGDKGKVFEKIGEVIVQRTPLLLAPYSETIDNVISSCKDRQNIKQLDGNKNTLEVENSPKLLGRKWKIVSFKWLN